MLDKGRISSVQLLFILSMTELATAFLYVPTITAKAAGPDGWISLLVPVTLYASLVALICITLARRYPSQTFTEYVSDVMGKFAGKIIAALSTLVLIHITSVMVVEGAQFIQTNFLVETPVWVLQLVLTTVGIYGACMGIEVIARHNEMIFPVFILSLSILILLVSKDINPVNFKPVMEKGIVPVLKGAMTPAVWRGELYIILWLYPYLNQKKEVYQSVFGMILLAGLITTLVVATTVGVFGDLYTARLAYPVNTLARYISVADILERLELFIVIMWVAGVIVKLGIFFHTASIAAATTLNLTNYRKLVIPVALAAAVTGNVFYGSYVQVVDFLSKVWPYYGATIQIAIPGLILLIAVIRRKEESDES